MPVLVKYSGDWADEFDVHGFEIMETEKWKKFKESIDKLKYPLGEMYFGTNESMTYESAYDLMSGFTAVDITVEEAAIFKKCFDYSYFGWTPIDHINDKIGEMESENGN